MEQMINGLKYDTDAAARVASFLSPYRARICTPINFRPGNRPADGVNSSDA